MKQEDIFKLFGLTILAIGASISLICTLPAPMTFWLVFNQISFFYCVGFIKIASGISFKKSDNSTAYYTILFLLSLISYWVTAVESIPANNYGMIDPQITLLLSSVITGSFGNYVTYMSLSFVLPSFIGLVIFCLTTSEFFVPEKIKLGNFIWYFNALVCLGLLIFHIWLVSYNGTWPWYLLAYGCVFLLLVFLRVTLFSKKGRGHFLCLYRYEWAFILYPITRFQNVVSLIFQGILLAIFVTSIVKQSIGKNPTKKISISTFSKKSSPETPPVLK